jgi:hypothetical protein
LAHRLGRSGRAVVFAKLKTLLRQAPERTRDGLWNRIGE